MSIEIVVVAVIMSALVISIPILVVVFKQWMEAMK